MSGYIEREKLIKHLDDEIEGCKIPAGSRSNGKGIAYGTALGLKMAKSFVETLPAADVVPKSECDKWYGEYHRIKDDLVQEKMYHRATEKLADKYCGELRTAKIDVARKIFAELRDLVKYFEVPNGCALISLASLAELEKKHTDSTSDRRKPVVIGELHCCPRCKNNKSLLGLYCDNCGQAIDWET